MVIDIKQREYLVVVYESAFYGWHAEQSISGHVDGWTDLSNWSEYKQYGFENKKEAKSDWKIFAKRNGITKWKYA